MCDSINTIGFIFNKSKTIIKCDKKKNIIQIVVQIIIV